MTCPICGFPTGKSRPLRGYSVWRCAGCGHEHLLDGPPAPNFLYDDSYFTGTTEVGYDDYPALEAGVRRAARSRITIMERWMGPAAHRRRLLDVGAAYGYFLDEARAGFAGAGIEPAPAAAAHARNDLRLDVWTGNLENAAIAPGSLDVVTLWDVIEHLADPLDALTRVRTLLRTDGWIFLTTGDRSAPLARLAGDRWHLYNLPEHLHCFSRASLARALESSGFTVHGITYPSNYFPIRYYPERLTKLLAPNARRRPLPITAVLPVNLWDIMLVGARVS